MGLGCAMCDVWRGDGDDRVRCLTKFIGIFADGPQANLLLFED